MAISKTQSVTGAGATLVLNSVASGSILVFQESYFRNPTTGAAPATPTDSNGTFVLLTADAPQGDGTSDVGTAIWFEKNAASGTHTVTPATINAHDSVLTEFLWTGIDPATVAVDVATSAETASGTQTSQVTGTTGATANAEELALISFAMAATTTGNSNVGLTDPVTNYTTLSTGGNDATDIAFMHSWRALSATGTQSATFNWTFSESDQYCMACIGVLKATALVSSPLLNMVF
jgi:hypothetical protein